MASVGLDKSRHQKSKLSTKFHYFTISFNEELTALYGPLLPIQTDFVKHCVKHVLSLFTGVQPDAKRPKSVLLIGNSMGGLIARGLFTDEEFVSKQLVHTIIRYRTKLFFLVFFFSF
jgi:glycosylphosphatidylinositol deacylase